MSANSARTAVYDADKITLKHDKVREPRKQTDRFAITQTDRIAHKITVRSVTDSRVCI